MHELEAVLGVILSIPEPAVQQLVRSLSQDEFASGVFNKVAMSAFGPAAMQKSLERYPDESDGPTPPPQATNAWQLYALKNYLNSIIQRTESPPPIDLSAPNLYRIEEDLQISVSPPSSSQLRMLASSSMSPISTISTSFTSPSSSGGVSFPHIDPDTKHAEDTFWVDWMNSPSHFSPEEIPFQLTPHDSNAQRNLLWSSQI